MALGTNKIGTVSATPGVAAAATARPLSGGRNVSSPQAVEGMSFAPHIGVSDQNIWRHDEEMSFGQGDGRRQQDQPSFTPLINRAAFAFQVDDVDQASEAAGPPKMFLTDVMRAVGAYENYMRLTTPGTVKPGSVLNYLY